MSPIKVLIVDDSAFMRQIIARMLEKDPDICVVGVARDGLDALNKLERLSPDVLTLDLEMPKMDGIEFLSRAMEVRPVRVVVVSSWATAGAKKTIRALELGAIDFVTKPVAFPSDAMLEIAEEIVGKVKAAAFANLAPGVAEKAGRISLPPGVRGIASDAALCCIAASTGGPRALQEILAKLPAGFPLPILFVQHMPTGFTRAFAEHLASLGNLAVREAVDGEVPSPGQVLIAPAGLQTRVTGRPGRLRLRVGQEPDSVYRPSADVTFSSIAESCGGKAMGVILTGMGQDGARGLLSMRKAGAATLAESAETCVIHGMPRAAVELGAAQLVLPLWEIPRAILAMIGIEGDR